MFPSCTRTRRPPPRVRIRRRVSAVVTSRRPRPRPRRVTHPRASPTSRSSSRASSPARAMGVRMTTRGVPRARRRAMRTRGASRSVATDRASRSTTAPSFGSSRVVARRGAVARPAVVVCRPSVRSCVRRHRVDDDGSRASMMDEVTSFIGLVLSHYGIGKYTLKPVCGIDRSCGSVDRERRSGASVGRSVSRLAL